MSVGGSPVAPSPGRTGNVSVEPQQRTSPPATIAQAVVRPLPPAAIAVAPTMPGTTTGVVASSSAGSPSAPYPPSPHARTLPSFISAYEVNPPTATATTRSGTVTTGAGDGGPVSPPMDVVAAGSVNGQPAATRSIATTGTRGARIGRVQRTAAGVSTGSMTRRVGVGAGGVLRRTGARTSGHETDMVASAGTLRGGVDMSEQSGHPGLSGGRGRGRRRPAGSRGSRCRTSRCRAGRGPGRRRGGCR
jgi:hypothetical protein